MIRKILIISLVIFVVQNLWTQELTYKNYNINDGLLSSNINSVFQDKDGYIWIATKYGVSKFDGYKFISYTVTDGLSYNNIVDVFQDNNGLIWLLSSNLLLNYIKDDTIFNFKYNSKIQNELYSNSTYVVNSFSVDNGVIKFGVKNRGLFFIYKNGNVKIFYNNELINHHSILTKNNNKLFIIRSSLGYDTLLFTNHCEFTKSNYVFPLNSNRNDNVFVDKINKNYYIVENNSIIIFDKKRIVDSIIINDRINYIKFIENNLWVATEKEGVLIYEVNDTGGLNYKRSILKNVLVTSIIIDLEGGYWISSENKGIYYIPELNLYEYKILDNNSSEIITDIISYKGDVYIGTNNGVIINITKNKKYEITNSVRKSQIKMAKTEYRLIICYDNKLYEITDNNEYVNEFFNVADEDLNDFKIKTIEAKSNKILLSSNAGFVILEDDCVSKIINPDKKFRLSINKTLILQDKSILIASENGLFKFTDQDLYNYGNNNPMLDISINDIFVDNKKENIFVATSGFGLLCIKEDTIFKYYDVDLSSDVIFSVCSDDSLMIISSNRGVDLVQFDKNMNLEVIQKYNKQYGLLSDEIKKVICGDSTCIYVMSDKGVNKIQIKKGKNRNISPNIFITKLHINNLDTVKYDNCKLAYNQNHISFEFMGLAYKNAGNVKYKYKLVGSKSDWIISKSTKAEYPFLPAGKYKFIVFASNEDGKWSSKPDTFDFEVLSPFWKTWWFILVLILSLITTIIISVRLIILNIKRKEELKKDLYMYRQQALRKQMNPHFIFNALNSIQHYILQNDKRMSNKYLNKFSSLMRIVLENSQKNLITIERELSALQLYLEIESIRFKDKFQYSIEIDINIDKGLCKIPPLLLQPYAENAIWHGLMNLEKDEVGKLNIELKLVDGLMHCAIIDNGVGREKAKELSSNKNKSYESLGSKINKNRLESIKFSSDSNVSINYYDLFDNNGNPNGTKVLLFLPVIY
jgi:ligand-binding sensor domain-containing protein